MTISLRTNEQIVLRFLAGNCSDSFRDIAKSMGISEVSVRRIHNHLLEDNVIKNINLPNFHILGYDILIIQRISIVPSRIIEAKKIITNISKEWGCCLDCHETFDGKIIIRSVWKSPDNFKTGRMAFYEKFGTEWVSDETVDMIPLSDPLGFNRTDFKHFC